uniref:non-specific serine/threonine protein kinase n=1 Tax=Plectus sambesii TaxID=2011161 RepID=A0A914UHP1_9BILA
MIFAYLQTGTRDPPQWMQGLWEQLESPKASVNVKLLVWRLVGHLEQEFRPYAKRWLPPLIKSLSDQTLGGPGLHYFRVDTLVSCLSWAPTATPSAAVMHDASRLLAFMIDRAAHENSVVLARNVRLVQLMCECWKGLSYRQPYLSEQLIIGSKNSDTVTPVTVAALQLTAVLIQNDIDPLAAFDADQEAYDDKAAELLSVRQSQYPGDEETVRLMGIACWRLAERFLVLDHDDWKELSEETKITAIHLAGLANDEQISFGRITSGLLNRADSCLQRAADARIDDSAVMTFANFCDFYINAKRDSDEQGKKSASLRTKRDAADYAQSLVGALFDAMRMGSAEARQLFPKLLNVIETFPDCRSTFADRAKTVPTWMFLGWLNQIIAVLDSPSATTLHDIVRRLSEEYPQAVFYPFNVSRKQWTLTDSVRKAFVEKLDDKFETMTLLKTLIKAVDLLCPPELLIKAFSAELTLAQAQSVSPSTLAELRSKTDELCRDLFVAHDECGLADYEAAQPGKFWRDFCKNHYPLFRKEFGKKGANIGDLLAKKQARSKLNSLQAHMKTDSTLEVPPAKLHEYSEWLGNFNAADYETELEIPGQYVGDKKPDVSMHVKICNFDERVAVFRSLAKPKAITIRGNDGHEYRYLVKGGEDLRQDERIEQLFGVINGLLDADVECSKRHLRIQTYRVVPLSSRLGLLQFVPNVKSLAEFLNEQMNADERAYHKNAAHMWKKVYDKECINLTADCAFGSAFEESVQKYSPDKAAECLRRARNIFRPNLLHSGLQQLCWDATGAALVQSEMTRSYAVLCVAHYLLGIGDRHLNNMMIDVTTGRMVGIDFGYAFGIGLLLDVPELVPFRLTRQFVVAMGPLGVDGRFTSAVRLCLRALRNNKQLLLNTMDVFVKEPSMNWTDQARRDRLRGNAPVEADSDDSWYPKQKLDIAAMKLSGRNPVLITCEELKQGKLKRKSAVLDRLNMILCGRNEKTWNEKKDMASPRGFPNDLTVDQQADCLVQLAADDAVVSRIYFGWEPWL